MNNYINNEGIRKLTEHYNCFGREIMTPNKTSDFVMTNGEITIDSSLRDAVLNASFLDIYCTPYADLFARIFRENQDLTTEELRWLFRYFEEKPDALWPTFSNAAIHLDSPSIFFGLQEVIDVRCMVSTELFSILASDSVNIFTALLHDIDSRIHHINVWMMGNTVAHARLRCTLFEYLVMIGSPKCLTTYLNFVKWEIHLSDVIKLEKISSIARQIAHPEFHIVSWFVNAIIRSDAFNTEKRNANLECLIELEELEYIFSRVIEKVKKHNIPGYVAMATNLNVPYLFKEFK